MNVFQTPRPLADKSFLISVAAVIAQAQEITAKAYGLTSAGMGVLATFYALQQAGSQARAKTLKAVRCCVGGTVANRTKELREAGLLMYQPGTNKGVMLTTAGKLAINALDREIQRQVKRLEHVR